MTYIYFIPFDFIYTWFFKYILRAFLRLNTIMDSDKVLVMDDGVAAEYDTPANLLANPNSMFFALVNNWENSR